MKRSDLTSTAGGLAPPPAAPGLKLRTFDSLRGRNFRWFWLGTLASFAAVQMQEIARGWLVYQLTHSAWALGLMGLAWGLPLLVFSLPAGVATDRWNKRNLLIYSQGFMLLVNLPIALLISLGWIQFWHLFLSGLLSGIAFAFHMPSRQTYVVELVGKDQLMNAFALNSAGMNLTRLVGPALAGLLLEVTGVDMVYYFTLLCYLLVIGSLLMIPVSTAHRGSQRRSPGRDLTEGLRYLVGSGLMLQLMVLAMLATLFGMPYRNLLPAFAVDVLHSGPSGLGWLMAVSGLGALLGSLGIASLGNFQRKGLLLVGSTVLFGLSLVLFSLTRQLPLALLAMMVLGVGSTANHTLTNTLLQINLSDEMRGRITSVYSMTIGLQSLSSAPAGAVAEGIGVAGALGLSGALLVSLTLALLVFARRLARLA